MLSGLPLSANILLFLAGAMGVWFAGQELANDADDLAERTNLGGAFVGLVLLATATELPEIVTTSTAAIAGNAKLVLGNMFGGITMQTAILAVVDVFLVHGVLTRYPRKATHALEAALLIALLAILLGICIYGEGELALGVGAGAAILAAAYTFAVWLLRRYDADSDWVPLDLPDAGTPARTSPRDASKLPALSVLGWRMAGFSLVILLCGMILVGSAEGIARQTGLGSSFIGATVLAAATSLPEVSTTIGAVRVGAYTMAISNIFGSNLVMLALLLPADILYRDGLLLSQAGRPETLALVFGIIVTAIYVAGLLVRRKPQVFGMGIDSACVLVVYLTSLAVLYSVR